MSWVKLDDQFPQNPKIIRAGGDAAWLYVCGLCYCAAQLTDGVIPAELVPRLSDRKQPLRLAGRLVEVGLWRKVEDGYSVNDFLDFNPPRARVLAEREAARERMNTRRSSGEHAANTNGSSGDVPLPRTRPLPEVPSEPSRAPASPPNGSSSRRKPNTAIPKPFRLTDEHYAWAASHCGNVDVERETERFYDWHKAKDTRHADWHAAWRNWMRKASEGQPTRRFA